MSDGKARAGREQGELEQLVPESKEVLRDGWGCVRGTLGLKGPLRE